MANNVVLGDLGLYRGSDCLKFDGVNDYVKIDNTPILTDFNISVECTPLRLTGTQFIWANRNGSDIHLDIRASNFAVGIESSFGAEVFTHPTILQVGSTYNISMTYNSSTLNGVIIVNGVSHIVTSLGAPLTVSNGWQNIGALDFGSSPIDHCNMDIRDISINSSCYIQNGDFGSATLIDHCGTNDGTINGAQWWKVGVDEVYATPALYKTALVSPLTEDQYVTYTDASPYYNSDNVFWNPYNQDTTYDFNVTTQVAVNSFLTIQMIESGDFMEYTSGGAVDLTGGDVKTSGGLIYVGTGGDIIVAGDGNDVTFVNVPSGSYVIGNWNAIRKIGTTATDIVVLY